MCSPAARGLPSTVTTLGTLRAYLNSMNSLNFDDHLQLAESTMNSLNVELQVRHHHSLLNTELEVHRRHRRPHPWTLRLGCFRRNRSNRAVIADNSAAGEHIIRLTTKNTMIATQLMCPMSSKPQQTTGQ
jgi:hypothetical protein